MSRAWLTGGGDGAEISGFNQETDEERSLALAGFNQETDEEQSLALVGV
ncbi:MAG: hypothetical protein MPL62_02130 [Alphaproteobacteria bacterium]|nr:hypothetical protein [Alphaproteobacteria bacterium]